MGIKMKVILFGAGYWGRQAFSYFGEDNVLCFCDNKVQGNVERKIYGKEVISFRHLCQLCKQYIIVVCADGSQGYNVEMFQQMAEAGIERYIDFTLLRKMKIGKDDFIGQTQDEIGLYRFLVKYYQFAACMERRGQEYLKRHVDITTLKPATGALRERQLRLVDFTAEFCEYAERFSIYPFLDYGNLIGAVRHRGFIPWDDDMDLGLMRYDFEKLLELREETDRFILHVKPTRGQLLKGDGSIGIDIWVYDFYKDGSDIVEHKKYLEKLSDKLYAISDEKEQVDFLKRERKEYPMVSNEKTGNIYPGLDNNGGYPGLKSIDRWIPYKDIFPLKRIKFEDKEFWAPNHEEELLSFDYVDFMSFPYDMGELHSGTWAE